MQLGSAERTSLRAPFARFARNLLFAANAVLVRKRDLVVEENGTLFNDDLAGLEA